MRGIAHYARRQKETQPPPDNLVLQCEEVLLRVAGVCGIMSARCGSASFANMSDKRLPSHAMRGIEPLSETRRSNITPRHAINEEEQEEVAREWGGGTGRSKGVSVDFRKHLCERERDWRKREWRKTQLHKLEHGHTQRSREWKGKKV